MHVKYLEERYRSDGRPFWVVAPKRRIRELTGMGYRQFDDRSEAEKYAQSLAQRVDDIKRRQTGDVKIREDTVDGLISYYQSTRHWSELGQGTKKTYRSLLKLVSGVRLGQSNVLFGQMLYQNVTPEHADKFYETVCNTHSQSRAFDAVKVIRKVWFVAARAGKVTGNPFTKMNLSAPACRTVLWEPQQVETFIETADEMGHWSMGTVILLCYHLCQRPGDMRHLQWKHFRDGEFQFVQKKTGEPVQVEPSPQLMDRIGPPRHDEGYVAPYRLEDRPIHRSTFYATYRDILRKAGLPKHLQARDLRRTGATEMAEAGCTEDQLRSITGHRSRGILNTYVRTTKKLSREAMRKRFG